MIVRPYILHTRNVIRAVESGFSDVFVDWCRSWRLPNPDGVKAASVHSPVGEMQQPSGYLEISSVCASSFGDPEFSQNNNFIFSYAISGNESPAQVSVVCSQNIAGLICSYAYPECSDEDFSEITNSGSLSSRLLLKVFSDLLDRLSSQGNRTVMPELSDLQQTYMTSGSGALVVRAALGIEFFYVLLALPALEQLLGIQVSDVSKSSEDVVVSEKYLDFCQSAVLELKVKLPPTKARVLDLHDLQVGQVLTLDCEVDRPLDLFVDDSLVQSKVYLGDKAGRKAVKIQSLL